MPGPLEHNRQIVTQLAPKIGQRNEFGNGQLFTVVFNLPGPADAVPCDHYELPFDVRWEILSITWRIGGGGTTIKLNGLAPVGLAGPYTGPRSPAPVEPTTFSTRLTRIYPEIISFDPADEGVVICLYGSPLSSATAGTG